MEWILLLGLIVILFIATVWLIRSIVPDHPDMPDMTEEWKKLIDENVQWYNNLETEMDKKRFREDVMRFLHGVEITPIETEVSDLDKLYIASSAIIPIFNFDNWTAYPNLEEVIVYPDRFTSNDYDTKGDDRHTLGMVGWQVMEGIMILSRKALRSSFERHGSKSHVGIHEFVHLLDKMDGATDGVPEYLLDKEYTVPWLEMIRREMSKIAAGASEINPYGTKNEAEFFAVVAEYFFTDPNELIRRHPDIYKCLERIFNSQ